MIRNRNMFGFYQRIHVIALWKKKKMTETGVFLIKNWHYENDQCTKIYRNNPFPSKRVFKSAQQFWKCIKPNIIILGSLDIEIVCAVSCSKKWWKHAEHHWSACFNVKKKKKKYHIQTWVAMILWSNVFLYYLETNMFLKWFP